VTVGFARLPMHCPSGNSSAPHALAAIGIGIADCSLGRAAVFRASLDLFFPPRVQIMALKQDADRFPAHLVASVFASPFLGDQPHTPPWLAMRLGAARHGDHSLALTRVQRSLLVRLWLFI